MKIAITAIAAFAGAATASPYFTAGNAQSVSSAPAGALATLTIDISGVNSWDLQLDADNEVLMQSVLANANIVGIGWDVNLATVGASWLSEATMNFEDALFLTVGIGDDFAGTASYSSGGILDLTALTTPLDFFLGADGILDIEFFESFDDVADEIDATFGQGSSLQIQYVVPAPGAVAMLGLGGLVAGRRRR
ncbi:MAG: PEP-CTERM sorting domain-containing protein [Phycisphaerales bacterium]|nr:PEP-CTERM sorting domain-containing protein [Phycisphaerales bacterium]